MTVAQALTAGTEPLRRVPSPELDAQVLLAYALKRDRPWLLAHGGDTVTAVSLLRFKWLVARRRRGMPVAYLTHKKEFFGRGFFVNQSVLIPRPETEILVEHALGTIRTNSSIRSAVEVGTGSGCIAVTLACELPHVKIAATDMSGRALRVAYRNAARHGAADRIDFLHGNLLEPALHLLDRNTVVISNPPYLLPSEISRDLVHEPRMALYGGADGLSAYRELYRQIALIPEHSRPGYLLLELHPATNERVSELACAMLKPSNIETLPDLSHKPRVLRLTLA